MVGKKQLNLLIYMIGISINFNKHKKQGYEKWKKYK